MKKVISGIFVMALMMVGIVSAVSISDIYSSPSDYAGQVVDVEGTVELVGDEFYLNDGTNSLQLGIGPKHYWGENLPVTVGESITVNAEVEISEKSGDVELEARTVTKSDNSVREIKGEGKPLWAGKGRPSWAGNGLDNDDE